MVTVRYQYLKKNRLNISLSVNNLNQIVTNIHFNDPDNQLNYNNKVSP